MSTAISLSEERATIHEAVREHYGARARTVGSSCCGPTVSTATSCCSPATGADSCCGPSDGAALPTLYTIEELSTIPTDAATASLGCGNPTAIAALKPGEVVLDLGSGGGIDVFLAARQVGETGFVYGVDMTDDMLALARRNAERHGITNVEFRKGHIEEIPLEESTVDVIISNCVINLSPDKGQTLHEAFRVLKPGGRLAVSDIVVDGTLDDLPVDEATIRGALSWAGCIAGALTKSQFETMLADAGFAEINVAIRHRYSLADLGKDMSSVEQLGLTPKVAAELVSRFTSCTIEARRPV
jgi:SAM-dependent methyltransferase